MNVTQSKKPNNEITFMVYNPRLRDRIRITVLNWVCRPYVQWKIMETNEHIERHSND